MSNPIKVLDQPPAEIGDFHIRVEVYRHHMEFQCWSCSATSDGGHLYRRAGSDASSDLVEDTRDAQVFFSGSIKWDGCSDVMFDEQENVMLHFCGRQDAARVGKLIDRLYDIAEQEIPSWDRKLGA